MSEMTFFASSGTLSFILPRLYLLHPIFSREKHNNETHAYTLDRLMYCEVWQSKYDCNNDIFKTIRVF